MTDLKQAAYCLRIPYYRYVMPVGHARTFKMERGRDIHSVIEALEKRRSFRAYGLHKAERRFGVALRSEKLRITGKLDLLLRTDTECFPVDFKDTDGGVRENHRVQLTAYALLVEDVLGQEVPRGFIYLVPTRRAVAVVFDNRLRKQTRALLDAIETSVSREILPEATTARRRCDGCEYRNYCGDVE